ncbi:uncharacterized protein L969DRAFT_84053 [Mixia osmundae IAM 14324]|uniref:Thioesterase domain-containing protein n=1 Tax=Mixia osmundae (strain CBS 9802 / IAM 14324 / JCM 22182 / KY 12970) TaxID=764103 RepID=G7E031_MIXOS|nr:uncharacterized protein L969DRAFT_84053 [Mixia osmundae IAM 14324]KEI42184.1 hypothetical protein L969DRAFT_84053 [Mixia osmundae IAM 14324]GAA96191.1 hypothetical protein E5Q_02855 [Mixia osmundae IAM 14324]
MLLRPACRLRPSAGRKYVHAGRPPPDPSKTRSGQLLAQSIGQTAQSQRWLIYAGLFASGYFLSSLYPAPQPRLLAILFPRDAPASPSDESPEGKRHVEMIEQQLQDLPIIRQLRSETTAKQGEAMYRESRPHLRFPEAKRIHSLTSGTLRGPGKLAVAPIVFSTADNKQSVMVVHVGRSLCGHDGIVHGGLLATLMDESIARPAILALPSKLGVTANLTINYRSPVFADQFVVVRVNSDKIDGRKSWASGSIEDLNGKRLVDAEALFIEPRMAKFLSNSAVREILEA